MQPRMRFHVGTFASLALLATLAGCAEMKSWSWWPGHEAHPDPVGLIAVLPIARDPSRAVDESLPQGAERIVTAEIYGALASSPEWRFVPDLTVADNLPPASAADDLAGRALKLGKAVHSDSVLFGTVSTFRERVGSEYGATQPAAVSISLMLLSVPRGKVIWRHEFNDEQRSLSENLLNYWQFWRGGPRWFSAREYARLGIDRMLEDLADHIEE